MSKHRHGLGRGLDSLIPSGSMQPADADDGTPMVRVSQASAGNADVFEVPVDAIFPNRQQPRSPIGEDDEDLQDLALSIEQFGVLQPLLVALEQTPDGSARFHLIAGERRWRAARLAGLLTVPVILRESSAREQLEIALVENLQRADLNPLETALGYQSLIDEYGMTQEQVADRVGRNRATIANTLRLLQLPDEVRQALIDTPKAFSEGHARAVLMISGEAERIALKNQIIAQHLSVRQAEELARRYNQAALQLTAEDRKGGGARPQSIETRMLEEEFTRAIEMKARLQRSTRGKGSLTLYFTSPQQLELLYQRIVGQPGQGIVSFAESEADANDVINDPWGARFDDEGE
jgi:ParB family transcriptional regulator, chromosome partitioning protein